MQAQLEAEQNKSMAVEKENRDLTGQLSLLREELEAEQVRRLASCHVHQTRPNTFHN